MLQDVSLGNKVTMLVAQRDFLNDLIKMNKATPEVTKLARDVMRNKQRSSLWKKKIMLHRRFTKGERDSDIKKTLGGSNKTG